MAEDVRRALVEGRCSIPAVGSVVAGRGMGLPFVVTDAGGEEVESVSEYLRDLVLGDEDDLLARRARAEHEAWLGEVEGIDLALTFLRDKRAEAHRVRSESQSTSAYQPSVTVDDGWRNDAGWLAETPRP